MLTLSRSLPVELFQIALYRGICHSYLISCNLSQLSSPTVPLTQVLSKLSGAAADKGERRIGGDDDQEC